MNRVVTGMPRIKEEKIKDKGREENLKIISKSLILLDTSPEEVKQAQRPTLSAYVSHTALLCVHRL